MARAYVFMHPSGICPSQCEGCCLAGLAQLVSLTEGTWGRRSVVVFVLGCFGDMRVEAAMV